MNYDKLLQSILDIGEEMVVAGAEVSRVEDSMKRMLSAYGCPEERINAFIITSNIQVTMVAPDGRIITQIREVIRYDVNFDRLDYLNDLSRYVVRNRPEIPELRDKFQEVLDRKPQNIWIRVLAGALVAGGFAIFFGGGVQDGVASALVGVFLIVAMGELGKIEKNQFVLNFVLSFAAGSLAILCDAMGLGVHEDKIMIGGIMLLIPGIALTNAVRDMLVGDMASGAIRLLNALLVSAAIASGFVLSIFLLGGYLS